MSTAKMHIMVGIDFSESSTLALAHAVEWAGRMGARLHLCYIAYSDGFVAGTNLGLNIPDEFPEAKEARTNLQRVMAQFGAQIDTQVHVRIARSPLEGMMSLIMEVKPDLVVVGSNGKGAIKRALLGSVSAQLAQRSPVPVVIVPAPGREQILNQPEPPPELELPAVGRAVANSESGSVGYGISGIGSSDVLIR